MTAATVETPTSEPELKLAPADWQRSIPVKALHVVAAASGENSRYAIAGIYVEQFATGLMSVAATDGRRLIRATWQDEHAEEPWSIIVPSWIVKQTMRAVEKTMPFVEIGRDGAMWQLKANKDSACFRWSDTGGTFPPYQEVIPKIKRGPGTHEFGVNPKLFADTFKALFTIIGKGETVRIYTPPESSKPILMQANDSERRFEVTAVVMPMKLEGK